MVKLVISNTVKAKVKDFLEATSSPELVATYLAFVEARYNIAPVLFPKNKTIYQNTDSAVETLEKENSLWHETEIRITFGHKSVNEETKKVYICPFSGRVFGDNTHPNPQDAIYDWVSKCPENTEKVNGLRVKRFYVSEDPGVIKSYIPKDKPKEAVTKVVYSSVLSGKLFSTKRSVIQDFKKNYLKPLTLVEVQNQNRFEIEEQFLEFIQSHLSEEKVTLFVEAMAEHEEFMPYVSSWIDS